MRSQPGSSPPARAVERLARAGNDAGVDRRPLCLPDQLGELLHARRVLAVDTLAAAAAGVAVKLEVHLQVLGEALRHSVELHLTPTPLELARAQRRLLRLLALALSEHRRFLRAPLGVLSEDLLL
eukprot:CAMPEP_0118832614 /NCGR_PEP_ID=MMETSP1162-20130426/39519_1 /TAXON_ID=33656 /ORGANISM="Phaeocystis Sp, Strain CCMP2710" /LENGTH=124 /DNA_ID=CAMNT_0006764223 /DNA_START=75 /DNA_END=447 /DNA_ORIENTATION=-